MTTLQQIEDAVDQEAAEVKNRLEALEKEVSDLKDAGGANEEQLARVLSKIQSIYTPAA